MQSSHPKSWESLDIHPELRKRTAEEWKIIAGALFREEQFTNRVAFDLVYMYAKAVGYESEKQVTGRLGRVGLWNYRDSVPIVNDERVVLQSGGLVEWRLGSPDWEHAKLVVTKSMDHRGMMHASVYPNTPYDYNVGHTERDIQTEVYFAEMVQGYFELVASDSTDLK
jgi:hypothetical protein